MTESHFRFRVRLSLWVDRYVQRIIRWTNAIHEGFWLGCLDTGDLNAVSIRFYQRSPSYNGPEHNLQGLFSWEKIMLDQFFQPGSRVLVAGAGGGRELIALHRAGYAADGFDCTPSLVETSRRLADDLQIPCTITLCPPNDVPPNLPLYDAAIVGWTVYTCIPGRAHRIAFLQKIRHCLPHEAPILVSVWGRSETTRADRWMQKLAERLRRLRGRPAEPVELGDEIVSFGYHHCFDHRELEEELRAGGFEMRRFSDEHYCAVALAN